MRGSKLPRKYLMGFIQFTSIITSLTPYLTWLGIMLTSKPNALQNRINLIKNPGDEMTTTTTTTARSTLPPWEYFACRGRPTGRYPHTRDCSKYFECSGDSDIVRASLCPSSLHFSPLLRICTLPRDAGCMLTPTQRPNTTSPTRPTRPPQGSWLQQIQAARFYKAPVDSNFRIEMYYDHDIQNPQSLMWPIEFTRRMWDRIVDRYNYGLDNHTRLYVLLRGMPQSEDVKTYATYLENTKGFLNAIEVGSTNWAVNNATNRDMIAKNIGCIASENTRGVRYGHEPGFAEIFVFDMYRANNFNDDRDRWEAQVKREAEDNVMAVIPLFSEWYLPIYREYGGGAAINRFLIERDQYFPKLESDRTRFARRMNTGEFIHFWSGAVATNLTSQGMSVWGWSSTLSDQYHQAVIDFNRSVYRASNYPIISDINI